MSRRVFWMALMIGCSLMAGAQQWAAQEQTLVKQVNESRAKAGLPSLKVDERLTTAARQHSKLMSEKNKLAHVLEGEPPVAQRLAAKGIQFNLSGENVGYNSVFEDVHDSFMESPPHRENILDPQYNTIGIGVIPNEEGNYWVTEDFAHSVPQRTEDEAEDLVAARVEKVIQGVRLKRVAAPKVHAMACQ